MRRSLALWLLCGLACATSAQRPEPPAASEAGLARGVVFHDANHNGRLDLDEAGVPGVAVSNGREVAVSDASGRYTLPVSDDTILFVIKPTGWMTPLSEDQVPRFYYLHKPNGSPENLRFAGVAPTGPLPASVDFPLQRQAEPERFRIVVFGDPQPYTRRQVDYLAADVVSELAGVDAAFGISLGDIVGDDLSLYGPLTRTISSIGIPWYNVHGNHDVNFHARSDRHSDETWERVFGPGTYAFAYGGVHFIAFDDVLFHPANLAAEDPEPSYEGHLTDTQLAFIGNYLATVPRDRLVVLMMHIPLVGWKGHDVPQRERLFALLQDHPYSLSLSAHTHMHAHHFLGREDGNPGAVHHHYNAGATCGSWWRGRPDEAGIPHTTMRDGTPNGYTFIDFEGNRYRMRFKAARRPETHQMEIAAPGAVAASRAAETEVVVNVFVGSERSHVELRFAPASQPGGDLDWETLERFEGIDPTYAALYERERAWEGPDARPSPVPVPTGHLWRWALPANPAPGTYVIEVRHTDMWGQIDRARRLVRIQ